MTTVQNTGGTKALAGVASYDCDRCGLHVRDTTDNPAAFAAAIEYHESLHVEGAPGPDVSPTPAWADPLPSTEALSPWMVLDENGDHQRSHEKRIAAAPLGELAQANVSIIREDVWHAATGTVDVGPLRVFVGLPDYALLDHDQALELARVLTAAARKLTDVEYSAPPIPAPATSARRASTATVHSTTGTQPVRFTSHGPGLVLLATDDAAQVYRAADLAAALAAATGRARDEADR